MIKAVIFDLENTLIMRDNYADLVDTLIYRELAEKLLCCINDARDVFRQARSKYYTTTIALEKLGLSRSDFFRKLDSLELKRVPITNAGASAALRLLSERALKLGIITNMPRLFAIKLLRAANIRVGYFDVLVTGDDTKNLKPAKEPFFTALSLLGIPASQCIMVGDRDHVDLQPAKELGMATAIFNNESEFADFRISSLVEIVDAVDALNGCHLRSNK